MSKVLVVSSLKDAHARNMCEVLNNQGVPNSLFSTDKYPYGQYLWTEELSKVKITDTFIDYLSGKVESRRFVHK